MGKYIDADLLRKEIENCKEVMSDAVGEYSDGVRFALEHFTFVLDSIQQDKESVELELCSQIWWEERGWIMIPPDATIEGIDSLLKQVRKKLQQEQPEVDLAEEIKNYFKGFYMDLTDQGYILKNSDGSVGLMSVKEIARHFYELGQCNTRK